MLVRTFRKKGAGEALAAPVFWSLVLRGLGMIGSFATGVLLARVLGPEGFGLYGTVIALALVLSGLAQAGLPTLALREVAVNAQSRNWPLLRGVLFWFPRVILGTSAALAATCLLAVWGYSYLSGDPLPGELVYAAPLVPLFALVALIYAELRGLHHYITGQALDILIRPMLFLLASLGVYVAAGGLTPAEAILLHVPVGLITLAIGLRWRKRAVSGEVFHTAPESRPRDWARAAIPLAASDAFLQVNAVYGLLIVGAVSSAAQAGYMRVALSAIVFIATPLSVFHVILAPRLAQLHAAGRNVELQSLLGLGAALMFGLTLASLAFVYLAGQPLIEIFFGAAYTYSWLPLVLLTAAQSVMAFFGVGWLLLSVTGGERKLTLAYAVSTPLAIVAAITLTPPFGAAGAASAAVLGAVIQNLICWYYLRASGLECSVLGLLRVRRRRGLSART